MFSTNLQTLNIHKLTREQYERESDANKLDPNALYLTPDEEIDFSLYATKNDLQSKAEKEHTHDEYATSSYVNSNFVLKSEMGDVDLSEYESKVDAEVKLAQAKSYADAAVKNKADAVHSHNDLYYTEAEIDSKLSVVNTLNTKVTNIINGNQSVAKAINADVASSANKADADGQGNTIIDHYETKEDATDKLEEAKAYADGAANQVKNALLNGAGEAYDTLKDLGVLIDTNKGAIDALREIASGKADKVHTHAISDVTNLQTELNQKFLKTGGNISGSVNIENGESYIHLMISRIKGGKTHSAVLLPSSDDGSTLLLHQTNGIIDNQLILSPTATHLMKPLAITSGGTGATTPADALTNLGLTATATELNYCDGVTSSIQTQLNKKFPIAGGNVSGSVVTVHPSGGETYVGAQYGNSSLLYIYGNNSTGSRGIYDTKKGSVVTVTDTTTTFIGSLSGNASSATQVYTTNTNPTTGTTYFIPFQTANAASNNRSLLVNDGLRYWTREGTSSVAGISELGIGNGTAKGTAGNKAGHIYLYGEGTGYTNIYPSNNAAKAVTVYLPAESGTLALTNAVDSKSDFKYKYQLIDVTSGSETWYKLFTINPTSTYLNCNYEFHIAARTSGICKINVYVVSSADKYMTAYIYYSGNEFAKNHIKGFLYKDTTNATSRLEVWTHLNAWEDVQIYEKTFQNRSATVTWNLTRGTAFPTDATSTITPTASSWLGTAASAINASSVSLTNTESTSDATYYVSFINGNTNGTGYSVRTNDGIKYTTKNGTTSASGYGVFRIGNNIASGTAGNKYGILDIYSNSTGFGRITQATTTTNGVAHTLPATGGTLLNTNTYSSYAVPLSGGTMTGTLVINKNTDANMTSATTPALIVGGTETNPHIAIDTNEIIAKKNGTTGDILWLNGITQVATDGSMTIPNITISSTSAVKHLAFSRQSINYITAPASGSVAFVMNGKEVGTANSPLIVADGSVYAGMSATLGTSSNKWTNVYATTFTGALSGNATTSSSSAKLYMHSAKDATAPGLYIIAASNMVPGNSVDYSVEAPDYYNSNQYGTTLRIKYNNTTAYYTDIYTNTNNPGMFYKTVTNGSSKGWKRFLDSSNYSDYALPLTGGTVSGSLTVSSGLTVGTGGLACQGNMNISKNLSVTGTVTSTGGFSGSLSGNATSATSASQIKVSDTEATSSTYYYPTWTTGYTSTTTYAVRANDGFRYRTLEGTASAAGYGYLYLGNSTATGTAGNKYGGLLLYSQKSGYCALRATDTTGEYVNYLPASAGTLINNSGGTFTGKVTSTYSGAGAFQVTTSSGTSGFQVTRSDLTAYGASSAGVNCRIGISDAGNGGIWVSSASGLQPLIYRDPTEENATTKIAGRIVMANAYGTGAPPSSGTRVKGMIYFQIVS